MAPREAANILGIGYSTIKRWIHTKQLRSVQTLGGHHRIPESELDQHLYRAPRKNMAAKLRANFRQISGRNQLVGRIIDLKLEGMLAQVKLSIGGQQITSIITAEAVHELNIKRGDTVAALIKSTEVMIVRV